MATPPFLDTPAADPMQVLDGITLTGAINTPSKTLLAHMASAIRRQHPQVKPQPFQRDVVCLVGGGPSLASTEPELVALLRAGAKLVTVNGAYRWCLERNLKPSAQILLDARPANARFVDPPMPNCRYLLASQCHPDTWDAVEGRDVWIWHAVGSTDDSAPERALLNQYYGRQWHGVAGGTTVVMRGLMVLRALGFLRFHLFGVDSCWLDGQNHAYDQPENATDKRFRFRVHPTGHPELERVFWCAPWHVKQLEDMLLTIRGHGDLFNINVHGHGLLAYALQSTADLVTEIEEECAA